MADRVGQQLGNYRLTRLIGQGGFGEVYLGEHVYLRTQAAIKVLQVRLAREDIEGFLNEARTIASLKHPHIVRVLDFGIDAGTPFLVMDYAPYGTLRQRYPKGTRLPPTTIVSYVKQVAAALQYAHDRKLVHRDIKPENMLLDENNQVLLSDFGIALVTQSSRYQSTQEVVGTVAYMAPEQLQGKPRPASDQYALGIVVYEWICGDRPFHGSFIELYSQHSFVPPPPLREKDPSIPPDVEHVVLTALAKDPQRRFSSVQAFANALEEACTPTQLRAMPMSAQPVVMTPASMSDLSPPSPRTTRPASEIPPATKVTTLPNKPQSVKRSVSRRTVVIGLVGVAAVGSGLTWLVFSQRSPNAPQVLHSGVTLKPGSGMKGQWTPVGNLLLSRYGFRATTLKNDKVLIEGGTANGQFLAESELFNPSTGTWTQTGSLNVGRFEHTATLLQDGRVLVAGGYAGPVLTSAELYDPAKGTWTPTGSLSQQRTRHTATLLQDGKVLVAGGWYIDPISSAEIYDLAADNWSPAGNMAITRSDHIAVLLADGRTLVAGGSPANNTITAEAELFDPTTNTWAATGSMSIPRNNFTAVLLPSGKVLAIGGDTPTGPTATAELFDPATGRWSLTGSMKHARNGFRDQIAVLFADGTVLIAGGDSSGTSEIYMLGQGTWTALAHIGQVHCDGATALLNDGRALIVGGNNCSSPGFTLSAATYTPA